MSYPLLYALRMMMNDMKNEVELNELLTVARVNGVEWDVVAMEEYVENGQEVVYLELENGTAYLSYDDGLTWIEEVWES